MKDKPFFSIIIPCFNQGEFLNDCLDSILNQNYDSWEAILVNDGSTDHTEKVMKDWSKSDLRINFYSQNNQGLSSARNTGLKKAKGEYLIFLDSDDWLYYNCLRTFASFLNSNSPFELIRCGYAYWDMPNGKCLHIHQSELYDTIYPKILTQNIGPCHSIVICRTFAEKLGGFDPLLKSCEDWDFWIRAGKMGARINSIKDVLVAYRYVSTSMSRNPIVMYQALSEVSRRAGQKDSRLSNDAPFNLIYHLDFSQIQKNHLIRMLGVMLHQGKVNEAVEWFLNEKENWNLKINPNDWKALNSYLSWGYFFEKKEINLLFIYIFPKVKSFFLALGYSEIVSSRLSRMVFVPQLKKKNHIQFGRIIGAGLNKFGWY